MVASSTLARVAPVAASCALHVALLAALVTMGSVWPSRPPIAIVEADLLPAEPPAPPAPPKAKPEPPEKKPPERKPVARIEPPPKPPAPVIPPRRVEPPRREVIPDPPVQIPTPVSAPRVESPAAVAATSPETTVPPERSSQTDAQARRRGEPTGPAVDAFPGPGPAPRPAAAGPPVAAPPGPTATARVPEGVSQLARPRGGYQVKPSYPASARRLGVEGTTLLRVYVAADGRVTDVQVDQSAGHPDLDQAATDAVRRWSFEPGRRGAEPVGMWVRLPVQFVLR